ncbi:TRL domain-containing protein [Leptospira sp. 'Mane']|uniref:TRL domain-containing protein n=1 Tax=Leptospira sp. 'Mane' TaxID=3387407 RepID=UPI00398B3F5B
MKKLNLVLITITLLFFANCISYAPPSGLLFTSISANKDVSTGTDLGSKSGESCTHNVLGWFAFGDGGIREAAINGNIKTVKAVDYSRLLVLFSLYSKVCTIARGD